MKADIHPTYEDASVRCSCGNTFTTRSTKTDLHVELCNECHPFFTGQAEAGRHRRPGRALRAPLRRPRQGRATGTGAAGTAAKKR